MWPFKKSNKDYTIKIVERVEYRSLEQKEFDQKVAQVEKNLAQQKATLDYNKRKFEQEKAELINEAKRELLETSKQTLEKLEQSQVNTLITEKEKENMIQSIQHDPYIDLDKLNIPYYNIRKAIRRAHAY